MKPGRVDISIPVQGVIDLFYQDFAPESAFIQDVQVAELMISAYAEMLNSSFRTQKLLNKNVIGYSYVEISDAWLVTAELKVNRDGANYNATLEEEIFSFDYDVLSSGLQRVVPIGCDCNELIRISVSDEWKYCRMPANNKLFYSASGKALKLFGNSKMPSKVKVWYFPALDFENPLSNRIPESMVNELTKNTLQLLLIAKQGVVIDKSNDGNPNTAPATEMNPSALKQ